MIKSQCFTVSQVELSHLCGCFYKTEVHRYSSPYIPMCLLEQQVLSWIYNSMQIFRRLVFRSCDLYCSTEGLWVRLFYFDQGIKNSTGPQILWKRIVLWTKDLSWYICMLKYYQLSLEILIKWFFVHLGGHIFWVHIFGWRYSQCNWLKSGKWIW